MLLRHWNSSAKLPLTPTAKPGITITEGWGFPDFLTPWPIFQGMAVGLLQDSEHSVKIHQVQEILDSKTWTLSNKICSMGKL